MNTMNTINTINTMNTMNNICIIYYVLTLQYFRKDSDAHKYLIVKNKFIGLRIKSICFSFVLMNPNLIRELI
jgi:hypothetical protein